MIPGVRADGAAVESPDAGPGGGADVWGAWDAWIEEWEVALADLMAWLRSPQAALDTLPTLPFSPAPPLPDSLPDPVSDPVSGLVTDPGAGGRFAVRLARLAALHAELSRQLAAEATTTRRWSGAAAEHSRFGAAGALVSGSPHLPVL